MPQFGTKSLYHLKSCHPLLQEVAHAAIEFTDFSVICGYRDKANQTHAYLTGASRAKWPKSKHNQMPSLAMDVCPYPVDWNAIKEFKRVANYILVAAQNMGIDIEWAGNWKEFPEFGHFQLVT